MYLHETAGQSVTYLIILMAQQSLSRHLDFIGVIKASEATVRQEKHRPTSQADDSSGFFNVKRYTARGFVIKAIT